MCAPEVRRGLRYAASVLVEAGLRVMALPERTELPVANRHRPRPQEFADGSNVVELGLVFATCPTGRDSPPVPNRPRVLPEGAQPAPDEDVAKLVQPERLTLPLT